MKLQRPFYALMFILLFSLTAQADPPFLTNGPSPTNYQKWELYVYSQLNKVSNLTVLQAPTIEIDWGALPQFEYYLNVPFPAATVTGQPTTYGIGDANLGLIFQFFTETQHGPQVSFIPIIYFPTGDAKRNLGNGCLAVNLPIAASKSFGDWTTYGNLGYTIFDNSALRDFFSGGVVLQRTINDRLTLGGEIFSQGSSLQAIPGYTVFDLGGSFSLNKKLSLQFSAGHSFLGANATVAYLGFYYKI